MPEPGVLRPPSLITLDGALFQVIGSPTPLTRDSKAMLQLKLRPFDWVVRMLNLEDKLENDEYLPYQIVKKTYPTSSILFLSHNPEMPIWFLLRGWEGDKINFDNPELIVIVKLVEKIESLESLVKQQESEIERLRKDNLEITIRSKEMKDEHDKFFGRPEKLILPQEFMAKKVEPEK